MYFYIVEQPKSLAATRLHARIKEYINAIGIFGEFALASPARPAEEIARMGIEKGYTTIVVIGSDLIVNKVAKIIAESDRSVLGVIPIDEKQSVTQLIGTSDWKMACEILKTRYLKKINLNFLAPNKYFITEATIYSQGDNLTTLTVNQEFSAHFTFTRLIFRPNLLIEVFDDQYGTTKWQKRLNWLFGKAQSHPAYSYFHGQNITLSAKKPLLVILNNEIIAKSPLSLELRQEGLKIITKRSIIGTNQDIKEYSSESPIL